MNTDELKQKIAEAIANGTLQPQTIVLGDNVQHKIENVEPGGVGIQIVNNPTSDQPMEHQPEQPLHEQPQQEEIVLQDGPIDTHLQLFKDAMLKVQDVKYSEIKFATAIMNQYEWYAVMRLGQDIGLIDGYTDLLKLMEMGKFKHKPNNPQSVNPYKKHINPNTAYPNWQCTERASEPFFRKFKFIADNTYSLYKLGCKQHHIRPFGSDK